MLTLQTMKQERVRGRWRQSNNRRAFLMRLWREDEKSPWRILLQAVENGERQNFANIQSFIAYLEELVELEEKSI